MAVWGRICFNWETCHIGAEHRVQKAELLAVDLLVLECTAPILLQIAPVNPFSQTHTTRDAKFMLAERAQQATKWKVNAETGQTETGRANLELEHATSCQRQPLLPSLPPPSPHQAGRIASVPTSGPVATCISHLSAHVTWSTYTSALARQHPHMPNAVGEY